MCICHHNTDKKRGLNIMDTEKTTTMSMREYSRLRAVTYEAVRAQVARYQTQLEGHTFKEDGSKKIMLDEWAIKFLDKHRMTRTVVMKASDTESEKEIKSLNEQVQQLQAELFKAEKQIIALQAEQNKLLEEQKLLIANNARNEALLLIADKEHDQLQEANKALADTKIDLELARTACDTMKQEKEQAQNELSKYHPSLLGFYRKDK